MATDRLKLYNGALLICGERSIASLTVNEETRRLLDLVWNDGGIRHCLEQAQWKFAMRASKFSYETSVTPDFGLKRAFAKPSDWVLTSAMCTDEFFRTPLTNYADEIQFWFADLDEIYVKYVSDDADYGNNLAHWPATFTEYVKEYFASKVIMKITNDAERQDRIVHPRTGSLARARLEAMNKDAMAGPAKQPARGSWNRARQGGRAVGYYDGGNRNNLIG